MKKFFILSFNHILSLVTRFVVILYVAKTWLVITNGWVWHMSICFNYISCPECLLLIRHLLVPKNFLFSFIFVFELGPAQSILFRSVMRFLYLFLKLLERILVVIWTFLFKALFSFLKVLLLRKSIGYNLLIWLL